MTRDLCSQCGQELPEVLGRITPREPFYSDDWLTLYGGDCREVLASLPADSVDCVVTSPPYWSLRDYQVEGQLGLEAHQTPLGLTEGDAA